VAGQDPGDRRHRDLQLVLMPQVPGDGGRAGIQAGLAELLAQFDDPLDRRRRSRGR
jgi:hypothetical protein